MEDSDAFFAMTALDESGVAGRLTMRFPGTDRDVVRLSSWTTKRAAWATEGKCSAWPLNNALRVLRVRRITPGVFEDTPPACHRSVGFREIPGGQEAYRIPVGDRTCPEMEWTGQTRKEEAA